MATKMVAAWSAVRYLENLGIFVAIFGFILFGLALSFFRYSMWQLTMQLRSKNENIFYHTITNSSSVNFVILPQGGKAFPFQLPQVFNAAIIKRS